MQKNLNNFSGHYKDGERKERTGHQLLNLFQDLGNRQLASTDAADLEAVYDTADREMKVCARMQNKFNGRNASCHALRARAALQQGKLDLADQEFVICEKIIVDVWGEDAKAWQDLLLGRSILRLRQKRYEELVSDLGKVFSSWDGQNLETWILFEQVLDRAGPDRPQMVLASFNEFEKLSPSTEKETEQFLKISNLFAHQLRQIQKYERYSGKAAIRSKKLLLRLPHADESLRLETEQVLEECADFIDVK